MAIGVQRLTGVLLLTGLMVIAMRFPFEISVTIFSLALLAVLQWRVAGSWLITFPIILGGVNLLPWTGWFAFGFLDMFLWMTAAIELFRRNPAGAQMMKKLPTAIFSVFCLSMAVSTVLALWPFAPPSLNSFFDYLDPYNALRILKGVGWAIVVIWLARREATRGVDVPAYFFKGIAIALCVVAVIALRERFVYADIFPFLRPYRVVGPFASMHVGGSHIGAFLVFALPPAMVLMLRDRSVHGRILGCAAVLMGGLTLLLTFSRASWLGTGVGLGIVVVLICLVGRTETARVSILRRLFRFLIPAAILGGISYIAVVVAQGGFLQQRIAAIPSDLISRLTLSTNALTMMDSTLPAHLFGMGLGRFPRSYYQRNKNGVRPTRRLIVDGFGERYLRSVGGRNGPNDSVETLFTVGQSISLAPNRPYRLSFRARASTARGLRFEIKEKTTLNHRRGISLLAPTDLSDRWQNYKMDFNSGDFGDTPSLFDRSLTLLFFNSSENSTIDIDDIRLNDETGRNLLRNGDFSAGHDHWVFDAPNHVAYQVKNAYVGIYFEQGLLGLISFLLLYFSAVLSFRKTPYLIAGLGSLIGFAIFSVFDNVLVAPRLLLLFLFYWSLICLIPAKPDPQPILAEREP